MTAQNHSTEDIKNAIKNMHIKRMKHGISNDEEFDKLQHLQHYWEYNKEILEFITRLKEEFKLKTIENSTDELNELKKGLKKCLQYIKSEYIYHDKLCLLDIQWANELKLLGVKSHTEIPTSYN